MASQLLAAGSRLPCPRTVRARAAAEQPRASCRPRGEARGRLQPALLTLLAASAGPAAAAEVATAQAGGGPFLQNLAGLAYFTLVTGFVVRLWNKRSKTSLTQRIASARGSGGSSFTRLTPQKATPLAAAAGAAQAGVCGGVLLFATTQMDGLLAAQPLPDQHTARSVAVTLSTAARGLAYLLTFTFGFNCLGLSALAVQLLFWPEEGPPEGQDAELRRFVVEVSKSELDGPPQSK